jgi:tetratricopeptide (TPR) repeat protein
MLDALRKVFSLPDYEFYAFVSYKRGGNDEKYASWIQRRLERYRIPTDIAHDLKPLKRLRIFRDKTDLGSHASLERGLSQNLERSRFLIVICSPRSAESPYVAEEVDYFMTRKGAESIIPFIIDGTPEPRDENEKQCYPLVLPSSLLGVTLADGSKEEALIKILARLLQVDYAGLYRRHLRATRRFMTQVCAGLIAVLTLVSVLALWAFSAERRATEQRTEAEGLIRFLTFDMADDAFDYIPIQARLAIAEKAQSYYDKWGTRDSEALYTKARYLMDLATTFRMAGDNEKNRKFRVDALEILEGLQSTQPDNEAYFELYAQALRQLGVLLEDPEAKQVYFLRSLDTARSFSARNPSSPTARAQTAEALFALANQAVIRHRPEEARGMFEECAATWGELFQRFPQMNEEPYFLEKLAQLQSSFSQFFRFQGNAASAAEWSDKALASWTTILKAAPDNLNSQLLYGYELDNGMVLEMMLGRLASAETLHQKGVRLKRALLARDPENIDYQFQLAVTLGYGGMLQRLRGDGPRAQTLLEEAEAIVAPLVERHPENQAYLATRDLIRGELGQLIVVSD